LQKIALKTIIKEKIKHSMRLNAFIAKSGLASRRKTVAFIKEGRVKVNGRVITEPWLVIKPGDSVKVDGKLIRKERYIYIVFNKPRGVTSSVDDKFAKKLITDAIPKNLGRIYPAGRLDKESRGLVILTNDGDFCYNLTHPKFEVEKEYSIVLKGKIDNASLRKAEKGVREGSDTLKIKSASIVHAKPRKTHLEVVVSEGKKRHLRRLFEKLGFPVMDLRRQRIGKLRLGGLEEGSFTIVDKKTIYRLTLDKRHLPK